MLRSGRDGERILANGSWGHQRSKAGLKELGSLDCFGVMVFVSDNTTAALNSIEKLLITVHGL